MKIGGQSLSVANCNWTGDQRVQSVRRDLPSDRLELELLDELDELFEEEFELELLDELELELLDELELELLDEFDDEFELELDELLPTRITAPSPVELDALGAMSPCERVYGAA
jgi:hypothetical protein